MVGMTVISCCAVFVCTLFLNYHLDIAGLDSQITSEYARIFYQAQVLSGKVVCIVSGGCLLVTTMVMLGFYIRHYIEVHGRELGILKALGYSRMRIAGGFWVMGLGVLLGAGAGFLLSFAIMPYFYQVQNQEKVLPEYTVHFHPILAALLVLLPALFFSLLAMGYGYLRLGRPVLDLLKGRAGESGKTQKDEESRKHSKPEKERSFLQEVRRSTVRSRSSLIFFIGFAAFCYASMMQMSFSMDELASRLMSVMVLTIGLILACVTLFLAITTVIHGNQKTIAMMRVFGYSFREMKGAVLGGYRPVAWIGFFLGTGYQYGLLKTVVTVVFEDVAGVPEYGFDVGAFVIALVSFGILYELIMAGYSGRIRKMPLKAIMEGE